MINIYKILLINRLKLLQKKWISEKRELTGRPTATLSKESLLLPALSFTLSLNVNLGFPNPPPHSSCIHTEVQHVKLEFIIEKH